MKLSAKSIAARAALCPQRRGEPGARLPSKKKQQKLLCAVAGGVVPARRARWPGRQPPPQMADFAHGAQVLALDEKQGKGFFKATVRKAEKRKPKDGGRPIWQYFVHYDGWNKRFDAWLTGDEVKEYESESEEDEEIESSEEEEDSEGEEDDDEDDDSDEDESGDSDEEEEAPRRSGRSSTRASSAASPAGLPPKRGKKRRSSARAAASDKRAKTAASGRGAKPSGRSKAASSKVRRPTSPSPLNHPAAATTARCLKSKLFANAC